MLPLVLLEIAYKVLWLILVAYPLWSTDSLAGSPAEERTYAFLWVVLPIIATPWKYAFDTYVRGQRRSVDLQAAERGDSGHSVRSRVNFGTPEAT